MVERDLRGSLVCDEDCHGFGVRQFEGVNSAGADVEC
jgi:hypothetical protein